MGRPQPHHPRPRGLIDQRLLPGEEVWLEYNDYQAVAEAIRSMVVRGAPAIGVTAAYGAYFGARAIEAVRRQRHPAAGRRRGRHRRLGHGVREGRRRRDALLGAGTIEAVVSYHITGGSRDAASLVPARGTQDVKTFLPGALFQITDAALATQSQTEGPRPLSVPARRRGRPTCRSKTTLRALHGIRCATARAAFRALVAPSREGYRPE